MAAGWRIPGAGTRPKIDRNARLRERRGRDRASLRQLAREFSIDHKRVAQILDETGGDPLRLERLADLASASRDDLEWESERLKHRIASDIRRYLAILDEFEVRRNDELLGLTD